MRTTVTTDSLPTLSVFDFDGTLTRHDSFIPFLQFAFGKRQFVWRCRHLLLPSLQFFSHQLSRDQLKARLIKTFLSGVSVDWLQQQAEHYCDHIWHHLMRPNALIAVADEVNSTAEVTLCSASPAIMLAPFAKRLKVQLIATELVVVNGQLTGAIDGENCRCASKVQRLIDVYGPLSAYYVNAWGDSRGDIELLLAAQQPHWRAFHPARQQTRLNLEQWRQQLASK